MAGTPYFSVVMPVYNGQAYVSSAIESVLKQTDPDWEFIIVDDCSLDQTPEILNQFAKKDLRIRIFRNQQNRNIAPSLNRGIKEARGRLIVRIDADDFFKPTYLEILREYTEKKADENSFFSSWITVVDEAGQKILDVRLPDAETIRRMMKIENFLYHPATSFSKKLWEKVGGYPEKDRTIAEDTALWTKFIEAGATLVMIPYFLMNYRLHYSNITSINDAKLFRESDSADCETIRQNREWRVSLYLKQKMLGPARTEILMLGKSQKRLSLKNIQYFLLTFLPKSFVYYYMWEFRPRLRALLKNLRGREVRV